MLFRVRILTLERSDSSKAFSPILVLVLAVPQFFEGMSK
jgi:hypothetical protein